MLQRPLRMPRGVEVGAGIPIGCMVSLAITPAVLVGASVLIGERFQPGTAAGHVVMRVIDERGEGRVAGHFDPDRAVALKSGQLWRIHCISSRS